MMKDFEHRTQETIRLFLNHSISYPECVAALDEAFLAIVTKVTGKDLLDLTALTVANHETVMREMSLRSMA
jgi:hypothetical protein